MPGKPALSAPLLLTVFIPIIGGLLLFVLVLVSFESGYRVAVRLEEQDIQELVELAGSTIEELWLAPRSETVLALSRSDTLQARLKGEAPFDELAEEWAVAQSVLEGYFFIYYGLEDGTIEHYPADDLPEDYDPRERPWYRAGMQSDGEPRWTAPYEEIITGEMVVSTVVSIPPPTPNAGTREPIGVLSTDMTFTSLKDGLERLELPSGGSVFMVDRDGTPFIGTDNEIVRSEELPESTEELYVASSRPLSSGWRVSVMVPRASLAESFAELRRPFALASATLLMLVTIGLSVLVGRTASRARKLAAYFQEATEESRPLRELFTSRDEFSYLNRRFNEVFHEAQTAQEEKLARERVFRFLLEQAPIGFFRSRTDGTLDYINPHCAVMLGYAREEAYAALSSVRELYDDQAERERLLQELAEHGEVRNRKMRFVKKSGERFWVSMTARAHADPESSGSSRIEGFLIDITEDVEEQQTLRSLAETDPLTGVGNRRALDAEAEGLVRHARANDQSLATLVFDIDDFKSINDTHGHDAGDALLQQITGIVRTVIRAHDVFARLGGDEFCVVMPEAGETAALRLAERLVDALHSVPPPAGIQAGTTLSIGVAALRGADIHLPELLKAADTALYSAKRAGRDAIRRASEHFNPPPS